MKAIGASTSVASSTLNATSVAASAHIAFLPADAFVGWLLPDAITTERAIALRADLARRGFDRTSDRYPATYRNNDRLVFDDAALATSLFGELRARLPHEMIEDGARWELCGFNPRFRACRYAGGQSFCIHRDGPHAPTDRLRSFLTVQLYLDDDPARTGGHTRFYADAAGATPWASIAPRTGAAIVFDHRAWHDGEPVTAGIKHVLRTDAMYRRVDDTASQPMAESERDVVGRHRGYAWHAVELRDGSIASVGRDGTARTWERGDARVVDLQCGSVTCLVEDPHGNVWCGTRAGEVLMLSADAKTIIAAGLGAITNVACGREHVAFTTSRGDVIAFEPSVVERSSPASVPSAWSARAHEGWAWSIAADGDSFLSCGHDGRVMRIDRTGRARAWAEMATPVRAIARTGARSTSDAVIIAGDERGWLHWLARDARVLRSRRAHAAAVTAIATRAWSARSSADDDRFFVSASEDGTVKRWHESDSRTPASPDGVVLVALNDFVTSVAFGARGDVITAGYDGAIRRITTR